MSNKDKILYLYTEAWKAPSLGMAKSPEEGSVYKAFIQDGNYLIDVLNEDEVMECLGIRELEDNDWKFSVITPDNVDDFALTVDQLAELSEWMENEDEIIKNFNKPIKITDEDIESNHNKFTELEIFQPNLSEGLNIFVDAILASSNNFQETEMELFYEKYTDSLLQSPELGKGGNIIAINNALMGYLKTDSIKFLHNIAFHCLQEIKRRDNLK